MLVAELQELSVVLPSLDPDIAITGFEAGEIEILFAEADNEKAQPEDWIPPMSGRITTGPGDIWQLGRHRISCGDARNACDYARLIQNERAATVFTDPPYNVPIAGHVQGRGRHRHAEFAFASGEMTEAEYSSFLAHCLLCGAGRAGRRRHSRLHVKGRSGARLVPWAGTTVLAAEKVGRVCYGLEYQPAYVDAGVASMKKPYAYYHANATEECGSPVDSAVPPAIQCN
jgi:hypothetical protein